MNLCYQIVSISIFTLFMCTSPLHCKKNPTASKKSHIIIDKIIARVNGANILQSDLLMPRLDKDNATQSLYDIILEELFFQQAQEKHLVPSAADVERQIVSLKMANNISHLNDEAFEKQLLKEVGMSLDQYKTQLTRILSVENIKQAEVSEKTFVTSQEVENYYTNHQEYTHEQYHLKLCSLKKTEIKRYEEIIMDKNTYWKDLGWVNKEDIDPQFTFVITMQPKQIAKPIQSGEKYIVLKLVNKKEHRLKTLPEQYGTIEKKLQNKKQKKIITKLEQDIVHQSFIIFL